MKLKDLRKLNRMTPAQMKAYCAYKSVQDNGMVNGFLELAHPTFTERWELQTDSTYQLIGIH